MNKQKEYLHNINIIVFAANDLQTKSGKHKFYVKIGVGKNKLKTPVVEDVSGNPQFNTDAAIGVNDPDEKLKFKIVEKTKNETLGQIVVHLSDLNTRRVFVKDTVPLRPHKKCPNPSGELVFEAWMEAAPERKEMRSSLSTESLKSASSLQSGLMKIKNKITHKADHGSNNNLSRTKPTSYSCQDVSTKPHLKLPHFFVTEENRRVSHSLKNKLTSVFPNSSKENLLVTKDGSKLVTKDDAKPIITGLSPSVVDADVGGAKVTIRGENLGNDLSDITRILLFGCDVLANLRYVSSTKLVCTTVPWRPGSGHVVVETKSGGRGVSDVKFTFERDPDRREFVVEETCPVDDGLYEAVDNEDEGNKFILNPENKSQSKTNTENLPKLPDTKPPENTIDNEQINRYIISQADDLETSNQVPDQGSSYVYSEVLKASDYYPWNTKVFDTIEEVGNEEDENAYESLSRQPSQNLKEDWTTDVNDNKIDASLFSCAEKNEKVDSFNENNFNPFISDDFSAENSRISNEATLKKDLATDDLKTPLIKEQSEIVNQTGDKNNLEVKKTSLLNIKLEITNNGKIVDSHSNRGEPSYIVQDEFQNDDSISNNEYGHRGDTTNTNLTQHPFGKYNKRSHDYDTIPDINFNDDADEKLVLPLPSRIRENFEIDKPPEVKPRSVKLSLNSTNDNSIMNQFRVEPNSNSKQKNDIQSFESKIDINNVEENKKIPLDGFTSSTLESNLDLSNSSEQSVELNFTNPFSYNHASYSKDKQDFIPSVYEEETKTKIIPLADKSSISETDDLMNSPANQKPSTKKVKAPTPSEIVLNRSERIQASTISKPMVPADACDLPTPAKQALPVGEIQPIMSGSNALPPSKPPRTRQELEDDEQAERMKDQRWKVYSGDGDMSTEKSDTRLESATIVIRKLEKTLAEKESLIKELNTSNRILQDERRMLQGYIEAMVSRALTHCPEILCMDMKQKFERK